MFPNLYYACKELFGIDVPLLSVINTAGLFVALAFIPAAWLWKKQMLFREQQKVLLPRTILIKQGSGEPVSIEEYPHQTIAEVILIAAISGVIGSRLSGILENPQQLIHAPLQTLLSPTGFSFYGGLVLASFIIWFYYQRRGIKPLIVADCMSPAFMIAYAVGRLGCQFSGDGDWGITNMRAKPFAWLPDWLWAYQYPHNVIKQGVYMKDCTWNDFCYQLAAPVYPTPVYEIIISLIFCIVLMMLRNRIKYAGQLWAIYLIMNGVERFFIEKIRVNIAYNLLGVQATQAEIFAILFIITGLFIFFLIPTYSKKYTYPVISKT